MSDKKENLKKIKFNIVIGGQKVEINEGDTVLQAAKKNGIHIPTLCYHEKIKPHGACRLCLVEIEKNSRSKIVASCAYPVEDGIIVHTESQKVEQ
ncbi:MAG: 2Fe-2S iron-sulfur cluster-binding protein, partial [Candidatus Hydromicrobium sp.]